ncbi:acyltransferase family protein [Hoeflea olei]|uniref:Acyltransferase 3 domain-containing protein n=1 Tax=Hoeflea olei TaxID=1480615 RepID=A0A1C1YT18_9HYPH|nr:acyltransferase [Hoeflea olei]OCW56517.1 hypothetical protein AWJ14_16340 [Hoeflea olei]
MQDDHTNGAPSQPRTRNGLLDLLRFAAALVVMAYHFLYRGGREGGYLSQDYGALGHQVTLGYLGVNLFFLISGFVIIWSASGRDWYGFAVSRFARLYPAHLAAMTITFLMMAWWDEAPFVRTLWHWFANLTMLAPAFGAPFMDGAYWSIVIELIFYFWVMIGLFSGLLPRRTDGVLAAWLAVIFVNNLLIGSRPLELILATEYGAYFALGAIVWRLSSQGASGLRLGLAACALTMTFHTAEVQRLDAIGRLGEAASASEVALANAGIVALFLVAAMFGRKIRAGRWALMLGGLSYPLYLVHQNAGYMLINLTAPLIGKWAAFALAVTLSLAVSHWIWRSVEPGGRRLIRALLSPAARFLPRTLQRFPAPAE